MDCIKSEAYGVSAERCGCPKCAAPQSDQRKVTEPLCNDCGRPKDHLYHDASIVGGTQHFFEPIQSDQKCTCNGTTMDAYCAIHGAHVDVESVGNESAQSDQPVEAKEWRLESPPDHGKFKQVFMDAQPSPASADARELAKAILSIYDDPDSIAESAITQGAALLESFRAETLEQVRDYKLLKGIRDKILARLKNPAPHAAELREQALDLANDEYNKLRKNLGYPPLDNKGRWIFEAERAKLESKEKP